MIWKQFRSQKVVGVGELIVSGNLSDVLATYALGSCIGVILYDSYAKVGGILHAALPEAPCRNRGEFIIARYVNTGVPQLFKKAYNLGATKKNIKVYLAGASKFLGNNDVFDISTSNYMTTAYILEKNGITVESEYCNKFESISVFLRIDDGEILVKTPRKIFKLADSCVKLPENI